MLSAPGCSSHDMPGLALPLQKNLGSILLRFLTAQILSEAYSVRYLSHRTGCIVSGVELQPDLVAIGNEVTEAVGLGKAVRLLQEDICSMGDKELKDR